MADNTSRNIQEEEEYLKLQKEISDSLKSNVNSFKDMYTYSSTIVENFAEMQKVSVQMKKIEKEILALENDKTEEGKQRLAILKQELAVLKKNHEQLKAINKQMASFKNLAQASFQSLLGYLKDAVTGYLDFDQKTRDVAANIGLGSQQMAMMRKNIIGVQQDLLAVGVSQAEAAAAQQSYADETGRAALLTQQAYINMANVGKATGMGFEAMVQLSGQMELFGIGAEQATMMVYDMAQESTTMGLNASKVIKSFQQNIGMMNRMNFKNGIAGFKKLVQLSEKYKIDMQGIAAFSEKAFRPEGAIEMAARLQTLGGSIGALGDPFQLMYKARNNPEKFAEDMAKATFESAKFNPKTGEFEVSAMELDRLRETAEITGQSMENLVEQGKQFRKINFLKSFAGGKGLTPDEEETIAMLGNIVDGKGMIQTDIGPDGKAIMKEISSLGKTELRDLLKKKEALKDTAERAVGLLEKWKNFLNQILSASWPLLEALQENLWPLIQKLVNWGTNLAKDIQSVFQWVSKQPWLMGLLKWGLIVGALAKLLSPFLSLAWWYIKGRAMGMGFNTATKGGTLVQTLTGKAGGGMGGGVGGGGMMGGGMTGAQTAMAGQASKAAGMGSMMKSLGSAAQIIAIAGAVYILAEAFIKFNDVKWESMAKGGVALLGLGIALQALKGPLQGYSDPKMWIGIAAMGAIAGSMVLLGVAAMLFAQGGLTGLIGMVGGLYMLTGVVAALGALGESGIGEIGVGLVLALGAAMLMMGAAVLIAGMGISMIVDSLTNMFTLIGGGELLTAALGFYSLSGSIITLSAALIVMSASSLLALPGLLMLGSVTSMLTDTATALASSGGSAGITSAVNAINTVDTAKLEALKDLSIALALIGASPTIKFDESLKVDGNISISDSSGNKKDTDWINNSQFIAQLQELIAKAAESSKKGGFGATKY